MIPDSQLCVYVCVCMLKTRGYQVCACVCVVFVCLCVLLRNALLDMAALECRVTSLTDSMHKPPYGLWTWGLVVPAL